MVPTGPKHFHDLQQTIDRKSFPSTEGLGNIHAS